MKLRKQYGLPSAPPHQGADEMLFDASARQMHARTEEQGRTTVVGSFERGAGVDSAQQNVRTRRGAGQITLTGGSATITGDGKDDLTDASTDETLGYWYQIVVGSVTYAIASIESATSATLATAWGGATTTVDLVFFEGPRATGEAAVATGQATRATGEASMARGIATLASGLDAEASGRFSEATAFHRVASGEYSRATRTGQYALGNGRFAAGGDAQYSHRVMLGTTANATPRRLGASGLEEYVILEDDKVYYVTVRVVGRNPAAAEYAAYELAALVKRDTGAASVALVGAVTQTVAHEDVAGWDATIAVDTTQGSYQVEVTGEAAKTIRWVAFVEMMEVGG